MHVLLPKIDIPYIPNTKPKKYVSELLLLIKTNNEQDFITWMNWHLFKIGVDHISIYDNESEIPIERLIKQYGDHAFPLGLLPGLLQYCFSHLNTG